MRILRKQLQRHTLLLLVLFLSGNLFGQTYGVRGRVSDTTEKANLHLASVSLLKAKDSTLASFIRTDNNGFFKLTVPQSGNFILLITYPGYADHADFVTISGFEDVGQINMITKAVLLQNVIVRASPVRMKGDTLSFLADSFRVQQGATVEDLLKRLPGISVNNKGEITAQGQRVQKVLVDGDEFFGDDPTLATRNLQANAVKEVQVFEKKSDQATFTGVDDGNSVKTINLKLKDEFKKGYFGKVKLGGGLPERWENQAMINAFKDKRKFSVYGIMSNTNNNSLNWSDEGQFGGNMSTNMEIGDDGSVMMWSRGDEFGGTGGFYGEGLPQSFNVGTSYANKWNENRSNASGAYRFQHLNTEANVAVTSQSILPDTQFFNNERGRNLSTRFRHKASGRSELFIDSAQSLTILMDGSFGEVNTHNEYYSEALNIKQQPVNQSNRTIRSDAAQENFNASVLYKLKFKKQRRTLSVNIGTKYGFQESDGFLLNYNAFFNEAGIFNRDTTDQMKEQMNKSLSREARVAYTEPVGKSGIVEVSYGISKNDSREKKLSFDKVDGKYESLNRTFSNDFEFNTLIQRTGAGYRYNGKKFQYGFGGDVAFADWQQINRFTDTSRDYRFTNFFPRANLSYKLGQYSHIRFNYNGFTRAPTANQLQPVADNNNPLDIKVGNPGLVQSFNHQFNLNYNFWKVISNQGMFMGVWFNPVSNEFSNNTVMDNLGRRISQTVNVNGNYNFGGYIGYNFMVKKSEIGVDFSLDPNFSRFTNFVNGQENQTVSRNIGFTTNFRKNKEKKYGINFGQQVNYNYSRSSIRKELVTTFWTTRTSLDARIELPGNIIFSTDASYNWRQQTNVFENNNNVLIWNALIEKRMSKKKDIRLGFTVNDILNQNIGFQRNISSNFVSERTYDVIRRIWLVTFHWNFNKGPQKTEE